MTRDAAYRRKLGTVLESVEKIPATTESLSSLEKEGVLHLVQVSIDAIMDVAAMLTKDKGQQVQDDYHNLETIQELGIVDEALTTRLATLNGLRNAIVDKYNKFEEDEVFDNLDHIRQDLVLFVGTIDDHLENQGSDQGFKPDLADVRDDLASLEAWETVLYGSYVHGTFTPRSDIDVAVITRDPDHETNRDLWRSTLGRTPDRYDVRIFELLPMNVQHSIVEHHEVIHGDPVEISYYFYRTRRRWKDVGPRIEANQFENLKERMRLMGTSQG